MTDSLVLTLAARARQISAHSRGERTWVQTSQKAFCNWSAQIILLWGTLCFGLLLRTQVTPGYQVNQVFVCLNITVWKTVIFKRKRKIQNEIKKLMKAISVSPKSPPGNLCEKSMLFCWEHWLHMWWNMKLLHRFHHLLIDLRTILDFFTLQLPISVGVVIISILQHGPLARVRHDF